MNKSSVKYGNAWAGDIRIAYQISGDGPSLVCCHAMGWDHTLWDMHRGRLSSTHQLITFDQRGSGDSDHPPLLVGAKHAYTIDTFGEDLRAVLDELGIEKAQILGYSMGAVAALRFATKTPERVERLILVSTMASRLPEEIIKRAKSVEKILKREGLKETYKFYFSGPLFDGACDNDDFNKQIECILKKATPHGFLGCFHVTIDRPSMVNELHKITAPTLILVGERDRHYLVEADLLSEKIPNARKFIVKNAGHALTLQEPSVFEDEVMKFIS